MLKPSSAWDKWGKWYLIPIIAGCATPQYAIRPTPVPEESASALEIERSISQLQGQEFQKQGGRPIGAWETVAGFQIQPLIDRLSRVSERPSLRYHAFLYTDNDPNAAALADGRIYISTGMLRYLESRGSRADEPLDSSRLGGTRSGRMPSAVEAELAFILGHEIAHTVAQHLVKRYRALQQQQLVMAIVSVGAQALTRGASTGAQQAGDIAVRGAQILQDVRNSGYSQEQELEADQLGVRYVIRAGFDPRQGLAMLKDFERFDSPQPIMRSHPYIALRRAYLERYLQETVAPPASTSTSSSDARASQLRALRETQQLYPAGSVSWKNLQAQLEELQGKR